MLLSSPSIKALLIITFIFVITVLIVLASKGNKRLKLILASSFVIPLMISYLPERGADVSSQSERLYALEHHQAMYSSWVKTYEANFDSIDRSWQDFNKIIKDYEQKEYSRETTAKKLKEVLNNAMEHNREMLKVNSPPELPLEAQDIMVEMQKELQAISLTRIMIIEKSIKLLDEPNGKQKKHEEIVTDIKKLIVLNNPVYIDIMPKLYKLKAILMPV
ncbi:hypothetical protein [Dendrosporobacter sp. 1207_IL3150]|uniref:hypothetical protein n=1 Tax=Dendrosporobacter sp. 1207_IL3150 TaxID=3084054 RepID=UPI002FD8B1CF